MSDRPTLKTAVEVVEILAALARTCWAKAHDEAECPPQRVPILSDLVGWLPECPETAHAEAADRLAVVYGAPAMWVRYAYDDAPTTVAARVEASESERNSSPPWPDGADGFYPVMMAGIHVVHADWLEISKEQRPRHPLAPLVDAWQRLAPVSVEAEKRADRRIMPTLRVIGPTAERERGMMFGGLIETRPRTVDLSLFPELSPTRYRVPLLEIVERTGLPIRSKGKGAPIEARLLVRGGLLMIRPEDRGLPIVRIAVTVQELLDGLWPPRRDKRGNIARDVGKNWRKLLDALYRARDWTVPDAEGGRWFPMALRRLPPNADRRPALDDLVVLDLAPVPGAVHGPSVALPWLDRAGVKSGPSWFSYIAGRSLIWIPGTTRRPVPNTSGKVYGWSRNPDDYPVLSLADLRRFGFGKGDAKNRTRAEILTPWQALPDLTVTESTDRRTGVCGWRLLPTDRGDG